jgi:tRNA threonylcarbamoyl adenosine modification protein YeaZ
MKILALDAALARSSVALVEDGALRAFRRGGARGQSAELAPMAAAVLAETAVRPAALDAIAVTVGPGSFTGLRAALALAHGLAAGAGRPAIGVTVAEAMAAALPALGRRRLWIAIDSRRDRIFLHRDGTIVPTPIDALPPAGGPVAIAGDAAIAVAARLAARGDDVMLTDVRLPPIRMVAEVAAARLAGRLPPLPAQPLYIDPPEARLPQGGLRPPPAG